MQLSIRRLSIVALLALLATLVVPAGPIHAATFSVTTTVDSGAGSLRTAITQANASSGSSTINFNIPQSDSNYNSSGYWTITPATPLPQLTAGNLTIDGSTQPVGNAAWPHPRIVIDGTSVNSTDPFTPGYGLLLASNGNTIRELTINHFQNASVTFGGIGIYIAGSNNTVEGCYIGTTPDGSSAAANNQYGISIAAGLFSNIASSSNTIGGSTSAKRNIIAGNGGAGGLLSGVNVRVRGASSFRALNNTIAGNYIGLNASGTAAIGGGNPSDGISLQYADNTRIDKNVISGHSATSGGGYASGIVLLGGSSVPRPTGTVITGNYIGTTASGTIPTAVTNIVGIEVFSANTTTIGGSTVAARNIISGNGTASAPRAAIQVRTSFSTNTLIEGNYIGLDKNGDSFGLSVGQPIGNMGEGVYLYNNSSYTTVRKNSISNNRSNGVLISQDSHHNTVVGNGIGTTITGTSTSTSFQNGQASLRISGGTWNTIGGPNGVDRNVIAAGASLNSIVLKPSLGTYQVANNTIQGNSIGVNAAGTAPLGTAAINSSAIELNSSSKIITNTFILDNTIGGSTHGIVLTDSNPSGTKAISDTVIQSNYIGTDATGTNLGITQYGIWIIKGARTQIGGSGAGEGNIIGNNGTYGIHFEGSAASMNFVRGNTIHDNGSAGIRVNGATNILISRTETSGNNASGIQLANGGNASLPAPTLTGFTSPGGVPTLSGTVANCGGGCTVEIFTSATSAPGEGPTYLTTVPVSVTTSFSTAVNNCQKYLTATVIDAQGNTSPFSNEWTTLNGCLPASPQLSAGVPASSAGTPQIGTAGGTVTYQHTLKNIGGLQGTFTLSATPGASGWSSALNQTSVTLNPNASATILVTVTIPLNAVGGTLAQTIVTAQAGSASATRSDYTRLQQSYGVAIAPPRTTTFAVSSGGTINYSHTITNTGNGSDTINLTATTAPSAAGVTTSFPVGSTCTLAANASCTRTVQVFIPAGLSNILYTTSVTATSQSNSSTRASVTNQASSGAAPQLIPASSSKLIYPLGTATFTHTLTNIGAQTGIFTPTLSPLGTTGNGWTLALSPNSGSGITLAPGASRVLTITATAPAIGVSGAISGTLRSATLSVTLAGGATATAVDTAQVRLKPQFSFSAANPNSASGFPLSTISFTHTLTNTANGPDSFTVIVTPTSNLEVLSVTPGPTISNLAAGGSTQIVIQARIKTATLASSGVEQLTVSAQTLSRPRPVAQTYSDQVTVLGAAVPGLSVTPALHSANPNATAPFTFTLTNLGNQNGTFAAPIFTLPDTPTGWSASVRGGTTPACFSGLATGATCQFIADLRAPAGTITGVYSASATIDSQTTPGATPASVDFALDVNPVPGLQLGPDSAGSTGPGVALIYSATLTNTGNLTDTFTFSARVPSGWTVAPIAPQNDLPPGQAITISISVTPPIGLIAGSSGVVTVTARSSTAPMPQRRAIFTTTISAIPGATFQPNTLDGIVSPTAGSNGTVFYPLNLYNSGSTTISYTLAIGSNSQATWNAQITPSQTGNLAPGATLPVTVSVTAPAGTPSGTQNLTILEARQTGGNLLATAQISTTALTQSLLFPQANTRTAQPGATMVYTHTLTNITGQDNTFLLATNPAPSGSDLGWDVNVTPTSLVLAAGASQTISVTVVVPTSVISGTHDTTRVSVRTLTSNTVLGTGQEYTTIVQVAEASLSPARFTTAAPGARLSFQHTLVNTGNGVDTFTISITDTQGWQLILTGPGSVTLAPGVLFPAIQAQALVPANVAPGTPNRITIRAISQSNPAVSASVENVVVYPQLQGTEPGYSTYLPLLTQN